MFFLFSFFFIFFFIYLLFGCSMFGFLPTSERGQETPTFWPLLPCPEEKLRTLLFSFFFQFGESFTRGERLENLSLEMKDWTTQNTRQCVFSKRVVVRCCQKACTDGHRPCRGNSGFAAHS